MNTMTDIKENGDITLPLIERATEIVAAYVGHNGIQANEVPALFTAVYKALNEASTGEEKAPAQAPAISIRKSITPDYIICLEDGKKFKSLKRHLRTHYDLTPDQYREKWGLARDYPMVAPNYAVARSNLAKQMGLGQRGRSNLSKAA